VITDSEDRSMITELEQIIQTEEAKPEAERDENLIDDCIHEIAELKGVKADFSDEEIDRITDKLVKEEKSRNRKRFIRHIAGIAAAFVIVSGVTACAINPALINWILSAARMPFGTTLDTIAITYTNQGVTKNFKDINDFFREEKLDVYYPSILPNRATVCRIDVLNNGQVIVFWYTDPNIGFNIQFGVDGEVQYGDIISEIECNGIHFDVYINGANGKYMTIYNDDGIRYVLQAQTMSDIITLTSGFRKEK